MIQHATLTQKTGCVLAKAMLTILMIAVVAACFAASYFGLETYANYWKTHEPSVLVRDFFPGVTFPESWIPKTAASQLEAAIKRQTARFPSVRPEKLLVGDSALIL